MNEQATSSSVSKEAAKTPRIGSIALDGIGSWRKFKDRAASFVITAGGISVLGTILLIFFYLLYEVLPLFRSAELTSTTPYTVTQDLAATPLYLAMEEQAEIAVQLNDQGQVLFFNARTGADVSRQQLPLIGSVSAFALNAEQEPLFGLASGAGQVLLAQPQFTVSYPSDQRLITPSIIYPFGEQPIELASSPIEVLALRNGDDQLVMVAKTAESLVGKRFIKEENFLSGEVSISIEDLDLPAVDIVPNWLLISPDQRWLYVISAKGYYRLINLNDLEQVDAGRLYEQGLLTKVDFLNGGISLLVADDSGVTRQWFIVSKEGKAPKLTAIREFQSGDQAIQGLAIEHRRKGFTTIDASNNLDIYYSTSARRLLHETIPGSPIKALALAPRANALLTRTIDGQYVYWKLHNEHPELSWSALWNQVWYENYQQPEYTWQSSAANSDFEPKYSFSPLVFGTLKAAFYSMLVATPLALCGAIYTAYFMAPVLRRKIKPLIELLQALPTVILGFLAGLWLAPFIEKNLPGIISIFMVLPVAVLFFSFGWSRLPKRLQLAVPDGWHAIVLLPVILFTAWLCLALSPALELWFFGGDMRSWLTNDMGIAFDQRNAMVVGIAMGFAVIPTIFSIAEDAIFSVPKSLSYGSLALGATLWQTLVGVVLPTASPGIFSAMMIGTGRAVGETMIVLMATGNTPVMEVNIFEGMRTLAANIAVEIGETEVGGSHFRVLFLAAFVLFLFTFVVNTVAEIVRQRLRKKYGSL